MLRSLICFVAVCTCDALRIPAAVVRAPAPQMQMAPAPMKTRQKTTYKTSGGGGGSGGGPSLEIAKPKLKKQNEDIPMWKVLLLGDAEYEEDPVTQVLMDVIPEIENLRDATTRYNEAQKTGKSLLVVVPKEHAEMYVEQLARRDPEIIVYADIEED